MSGVSLVVTDVTRTPGRAPIAHVTSVTARRSAQVVRTSLQESLQLVSGLVPVTMRRRPDATRGTATARRSSTRCSRCYDAGILRPSVHEVAGARRRVGPIGAQPLRRRRGAARRGRAAAVGAVRAAARSTPAVVDASTSSSTSAAAFFEAVTPVRRAALLSVHDSPTIARTSRGSIACSAASSSAAFPDLDADGSTRSTLVTLGHLEPPAHRAGLQRARAPGASLERIDSHTRPKGTSR